MVRRPPDPAPLSLAARMARGDVFEPGCPSREIMRHVTSRWGVLILIALQGGVHRFSALRRKVNGVSERMLAETLTWLEADGLVERRAFPVVPPHVEYSLTSLGSEAAQKVASLADWIEENLPQLLARSAADSEIGPSGPADTVLPALHVRPLGLGVATAPPRRGTR